MSSGRAAAALPNEARALGSLPSAYAFLPADVRREGRRSSSSASRDDPASAVPVPARRRRREDRRAPARLPPSPKIGKGKHEAQAQGRQPDGEGQLEALLLPVRVLARQALALHALDRRRDGREGEIPRRRDDRLPARASGDRLERLGVKAGHHRGAVGGLLVAVALAARVEVGHGLSGRRAHPDRVNHHSRLLRLADRRLHLPLEVLAVGNEHHHLVAASLVHERGEAPGQAGSQGAARRWDGAGLESVEEEADGVGIEGEGDERVGIAFERHEGETVAVEAGDEIHESGLRQVEAIRRHVLRGHGARRVEDDHDVHPLALHLLAHDAPLGASEGEDDPCRAHEDQGQSEQTPVFPGSPHDLGPEGARDDEGGSGAIATRGPGLREPRQGQGQKRPEPERLREDHGLTPAPLEVRPGPAGPRPPASRRPRPGPEGRARGSGGRSRA